MYLFLTKVPCIAVNPSRDSCARTALLSVIPNGDVHAYVSKSASAVSLSGVLYDCHGLFRRKREFPWRSNPSNWSAHTLHTWNSRASKSAYSFSNEKFSLVCYCTFEWKRGEEGVVHRLNSICSLQVLQDFQKMHD